MSRVLGVHLYPLLQPPVSSPPLSFFPSRQEQEIEGLGKVLLGLLLEDLASTLRGLAEEGSTDTLDHDPGQRLVAGIAVYRNGIHRSRGMTS